MDAGAERFGRPSPDFSGGGTCGPRWNLRPALLNSALRKRAAACRSPWPPMPGKSDRSHVLIREAPARFRLVRFSSIHNAMAQLLGKQGLALPAEAGDDARAGLWRPLSSKVAVHSDLALPKGHAKPVDADTTPHVHIMPWQEGLSAEFRVRPFGSAGGASFKPGTGSCHVFMEADGKSLTTTRDLKEEKKRADAVVARVPKP